MPTIPDPIPWRTAPLTVTLICEDRASPDCQDTVTVHVTEAAAARIDRKRPVGVGGAWYGAMADQAPGWHYKFPFAPPNRKIAALDAGERRVICPACYDHTGPVVRLTHWTISGEVPARPRKGGPAAPSIGGPVRVYGIDADGCERLYAKFPDSESFHAWVPTDRMADEAFSAQRRRVHSMLIEKDPLFREIYRAQPPKEESAAYAAWLVLWNRYWDRLGGRYSKPDPDPEATKQATDQAVEALIAYWRGRGGFDAPTQTPPTRPARRRGRHPKDAQDAR